MMIFIRFFPETSFRCVSRSSPMAVSAFQMFKPQAQYIEEVPVPSAPDTKSQPCRQSSEAMFELTKQAEQRLRVFETGLTHGPPRPKHLQSEPPPPNLSMRVRR